MKITLLIILNLILAYSLLIKLNRGKREIPEKPEKIALFADKPFKKEDLTIRIKL